MSIDCRRSGEARALRAGGAYTVLLALGCSACMTQSAPSRSERPEVAVGVSLLTAEQRRERAGQIRDAALASGMTQGYLLAGIADAETSMSHCWSELTWACQGPSSPDCGGGPVVAGAGDGPCELQQGGLGMFQFDAGTYADTLARDGERVLYIDGNVQAAVDFVVSMLIRSVYVDGVDDAAQAIAWSNGVRRDNERWDPWISTVTHYYNGCTPSASCWAQRRAHYLDNTSAVYDEMGADFWLATREFAASYVDQTFPLAAEPFELAPGEQVRGYIELRNDGSATWTPGATFLGTTQPRDVHSALASADWVAPHRAATVDHVVAPGESGRFEFAVQAPSMPGDYPQFFNLVQENVAWFGDQGGPPDDQLQVRVTVVARSADAGGNDRADASTDDDCARDGGGCPPQRDASVEPRGDGAAGRGPGGAGRHDDGTDGGGPDGGDADGGEAGSGDDGGCRAAAGGHAGPGVLPWLALALLLQVARARSNALRSRRRGGRVVGRPASPDTCARRDSNS